MNAQRRKELARAIQLMSEARQIIEDVSSEEREAFDNMPEGLQQSERGERMSEIADNLDDMTSQIEDIENTIQEACE